MNTALPCDYAALADALDRAGVLTGPAEAQATAVALVFASAKTGEATWEQHLLADADGTPDQVQSCRMQLHALYAEVTRLAADDFALRLCLPDFDRASTRARAVALRDWCRGFLYGLGLAGRQGVVTSGTTAYEALQDLAEIGQLDADSVGSGEGDEADLMELEEYVRVAAMLVRDELRDLPRRADEQG